MIIEHFGLATTASTWYLAGGLLVLWLLTLPLLVRFRDGWSDVVLSLLGLSWLAFGLGILVRFALLSYDAELFASPSTHLAEIPPEMVDFALMAAGLYWLTFTAGAATMRLFPTPSVLTTLVRQADRLSPGSLVPAVALSAACVVAAQLPGVPGVLVTPLSVLGSMWVIPATYAWTRHFKGESRERWQLAAVFIPGVLRFVLSPYREQILVMALVVFASAIFARRRFRLLAVVPLVFVIAVASTIGVAAYRQVLWSGMAPMDAIRGTSLTELSGSSLSPVVENLQRFHVFDSLLLTVDLVPEVFAFADRNPLLEGVTRGIVPRLFNPDKQQSNEAMRFQVTFWSYYNDPTLEQEDATATIAPSMPGSLYEAGDLYYVAIGGFLWALLLAVIDRTTTQYRTPATVGLYVLCAVQALAGLERDYAMAMSTLLQTLLVFFALCTQAWLISRRPELAFRPSTAAPVP